VTCCKVQSQSSLRETEENHKNLSQDSFIYEFSIVIMIILSSIRSNWAVTVQFVQKCSLQKL
jgi:hypothetical protein